MPVSNLPAKLQERFTLNGYESTLDLRNYPLDSLSSAEFSALLNLLKENSCLRSLILANCGLARLKVELLGQLLSNLNHLIGLNLDNNDLSSDSERLKQVYQRLECLPQLRVFSIQERKLNQQKRAPEFFTGLRTLPTLRAFKVDENVISFLNFSEIVA